MKIIIKPFFLLLLMACAACEKDKNKDTADQTPTPENYTVNATVSTVAGSAGQSGNQDGRGSEARFSGPKKMIYDDRDQSLYIVDDPATIRKMDAQNNISTYLPAGMLSVYNSITDICLAPGAAGNLYVTTSRALYKISPSGNMAQVTTLINNGPGNASGSFSQAELDGACGLAAGLQDQLYFFNGTWNTLNKISFTSTNTGMVNPFAGKPLEHTSDDAWPYQDGQGLNASFGGRVKDMASDAGGNLYVADYDNNVIRKISPDGTVSSLFKRSADFDGADHYGPVSTATSNRVFNVAPSSDGSMVFFTSFGPLSPTHSNPSLRMVQPGKQVLFVAGGKVGYKDGVGGEAAFGGMDGIAVEPDGKTIYISEYSNKVIRKVSLQ